MQLVNPSSRSSRQKNAKVNLPELLAEPKKIHFEEFKMEHSSKTLNLPWCSVKILLDPKIRESFGTLGFRLERIEDTVPSVERFGLGSFTDCWLPIFDCFLNYYLLLNIVMVAKIDDRSFSKFPTQLLMVQLSNNQPFTLRSSHFYQYSSFIFVFFSSENADSNNIFHKILKMSALSIPKALSSNRRIDQSRFFILYLTYLSPSSQRLSFISFSLWKKLRVSGLTENI